MARLVLGLAVGWVVLGLAGTAWGEEPATPESSEAVEADNAELLLEQLLATDRAWADTPPDAEAFAAFFANGGRLFPPGAALVEGQEAILESMGPLFGSPGYGLTWRATGADIAASGDLGFTFGTFEERGQDDAGSPTLTVGKYVTVWRRGDDRTWRVVADIFNSD
jgi:ketosteroid isomerase-like protein